MSSVLPSGQGAVFLSQCSKVYATSMTMNMSEPRKQSRDCPPGLQLLLEADKTLRRWNFKKSEVLRCMNLKGMWDLDLLLFLYAP